jgi:hypothetical protein
MLTSLLGFIPLRWQAVIGEWLFPNGYHFFICPCECFDARAK